MPGGIRAVLAENLATMCLDLEVASGNDQTFSHSDIRRTARMLMQMLPGTDLIFSGYSSVPNYDNMFAGSNFDWAGPLTEVVLLGNIALRPELRETLTRQFLTWDPVAFKITNLPEADRFLHVEYRTGWKLEA